VDEVVAEVEQPDPRVSRGGVSSEVVDEDELLYGETAPSLFSVELESSVPDKHSSQVSCQYFQNLIFSGVDVRFTICILGKQCYNILQLFLLQVEFANIFLQILWLKCLQNHNTEL
jgi:hypothetical protein